MAVGACVKATASSVEGIGGLTLRGSVAFLWDYLTPYSYFFVCQLRRRMVAPVRFVAKPLGGHRL